MRKKKDQKNILIGVLLLAIVIMSVGYAAFAVPLAVTGTSKITGNWNVAITDITVSNTQGGATSTSATYTSTTATFAADLKQPGDSIEYTITVTNDGSIDARLDQIVPVITGDAAAISYDIDAPLIDSVLAAHSTATVKITAIYDINATENVDADANSKTLTVTLDYVQNS